jgi:hypothetical protein
VKENFPTGKTHPKKAFLVNNMAEFDKGYN